MKTIIIKSLAFTYIYILASFNYVFGGEVIANHHAVGSTKIALIKGYFDNFSYKQGVGIVYLLNEYADITDPNVMFTHVCNDGSFRVELMITKAKVLFLYIPMKNGKLERIPVIAMPNDSTELLLSTRDDGVCYDYLHIPSNNLGITKASLGILRGYPNYLSYAMKDCNEFKQYMKNLKKHHRKNKTKYRALKKSGSLSDAECYFLRQNEELDYATNILYYNKQVEYYNKHAELYSCKAKHVDFDKNVDLSLLENDDCYAQFSFNRFLFAYNENDSDVNDKVSNFSAKLQQIKTDSGRVLQRNSSDNAYMKILAPYLAANRGKLIQVVFVDSGDKYINILRNLDNLLYDFHDNPDLKFLFIGSKDVCNEIDNLKAVFFPNEDYLEVTGEDYYLLNESFGNYHIPFQSKTIGKDGHLLQNPLNTRNETEFRRHLRNMLK